MIYDVLKDHVPRIDFKALYAAQTTLLAKVGKYLLSKPHKHQKQGQKNMGKEQERGSKVKHKGFLYERIQGKAEEINSTMNKSLKGYYMKKKKD